MIDGACGCLPGRVRLIKKNSFNNHHFSYLSFSVLFSFVCVFSATPTPTSFLVLDNINGLVLVIVDHGERCKRAFVASFVDHKLSVFCRAETLLGERKRGGKNKFIIACFSLSRDKSKCNFLQETHLGFLFRQIQALPWRGVIHERCV